MFYEKEEDVAWLRQAIIDFDVNLENLRIILDGNPQTVGKHAFRTIVKNGMQRGGMMAAGVGFIKSGEAGRG